MNLGTEGIRKQAGELIEQAYQRGFKAGQDKNVEQYKKAWGEQAKDYIEIGRNEAWDVAQKLVSMDYKECNEVLSDGTLTINFNDDIFTKCTASEAIEKIREYEKKKNGEIKVGDEVIYHDDKGVVVLVANNGNAISVMSASGGWMIRANSEDLVKTGRHFPQIAEVLEKVKKVDNCCMSNSDLMKRYPDAMADKEDDE